jgi:hypothetical protein
MGRVHLSSSWRSPLTCGRQCSTSMSNARSPSQDVQVFGIPGDDVAEGFEIDHPQGCPHVVCGCHIEKGTCIGPRVPRTLVFSSSALRARHATVRTRQSCLPLAYRIWVERLDGRPRTSSGSCVHEQPHRPRRLRARPAGKPRPAVRRSQPCASPSEASLSDGHVKGAEPTA